MDYLDQLVVIARSQGTTYLHAVGLCVCFSVFEYRNAGRGETRLAHRLDNFRIRGIVAIVLLFLRPFMNRFVEATSDAQGLLDVVLPGWKRAGSFPTLHVALVYAFVWDFFQYWSHRLLHRVPRLWAIHRTHHSDAHMNSSSAGRQNVAGSLVSFALNSVPTIAICGLDSITPAWAFLFFAVVGPWNHANLRIELGPLTPVVTGPSWHRLHHGVATEYHDCNYAAFFPVLDILFGTYRRPRPDEHPATGVDDEELCESPEME